MNEYTVYPNTGGNSIGSAKTNQDAVIIGRKWQAIVTASKREFEVFDSKGTQVFHSMNPTNLPLTREQRIKRGMEKPEQPKGVYGCLDCGEEREPSMVNGCSSCPDCGSQKLTGPI